MSDFAGIFAPFPFQSDFCARKRPKLGQFLLIERRGGEKRENKRKRKLRIPERKRITRARKIQRESFARNKKKLEFLKVLKVID